MKIYHQTTPQRLVYIPKGDETEYALGWTKGANAHWAYWGVGELDVQGGGGIVEWVVKGMQGVLALVLLCMANDAADWRKREGSVGRAISEAE